MSLMLLSVVSFDVMAKGGKGKNRGNFQATFDDKGCLVANPDENKNPKMDILKVADANGDGCVSEDEYKTHMENRKENKGEGRRNRQK